MKAIDNCIKVTNVEKWKNIPLPVCSATSEMLQCIDYIKKFILFLDGRFTNLIIASE